MPTYTFRHRETQEIQEMFLTISGRASFLDTHPEYEQVILEAPSVGDPAALGKQKPPTDFLKYVRDPILQRNQSPQIAASRYQTPREV